VTVIHGSDLEEPATALLAFNGHRHGPLKVRRIVPVAPVSEGEVLDLAAQADWRACPAVGEALADAIRERAGRDPRHDTQRAKRNISAASEDRTQAPAWHAIPYHGMDGRVGSFHVLIGTADFLEDAGIPIPESSRRLAREHGSAGWASLWIGAITSDTQPRTHRSLIGIVAIGPAETRATTTGGESAALPLPHLAALKPTRLAAKLFPRFMRTVRPHMWWLVPLIGISAVAGAWLSTLRVRAGRVAVVTRLGHVTAVLGPGLHVRPAWLFEKVRHIEPHVERTIIIGPEPLRDADPDGKETFLFESLFWSGDLWPTEHEVATSPSAPETRTATSPGYPMQVRACVRYIICDPRAFVLNASEADEIVQTVSESILRQLVAGTPMLETAGPARGALANRAAVLIQQKLDAVGCGVEVTGVRLEQAAPSTAEGSDAASALLERLARARVVQAAQIAEARRKADTWTADARRRGAVAVATAVRRKQSVIKQAETLKAQVAANLTAFVMDPEQTRRRLLTELIAETPADPRRRLMDPAIRGTVSALIDQLTARNPRETPKTTARSQPAMEPER